MIEDDLGDEDIEEGMIIGIPKLKMRISECPYPFREMECGGFDEYVCVQCLKEYSNSIKKLYMGN